MKRIGISEVKTHFLKLLDQVARGEQITITRHGLPVAMLIPVPPPVKTNSSQAAKRIKKGVRWKLPKGISVKDLIQDGRS